MMRRSAPPMPRSGWMKMMFLRSFFLMETLGWEGCAVGGEVAVVTILSGKLDDCR